MNRNRRHLKGQGPRPITEAEFFGALNFVAGEKGATVPERGVLLGLAHAGFLVEHRVGVGGMGRKFELTPRGTVERLARMKT